MGTPSDADTPQPLAAQVAQVPFWYHTMDLGQGVSTPGEFDLRGSVHTLPWPDLTGLRCLDVATYDGFYAFEMERRGAAEVVAIDLDDAADLDWLPRRVPAGFERGQQPIGTGFRIARDALGSDVTRVSHNVYDLDPQVVGTFDFVVCGALLQHLRDPHLALQSIRGVTTGKLLSVELVDALASVGSRRRPIRVLRGSDYTWAVGNVTAHHRMLEMAGWNLVTTGLLGMSLGPAGHAMHARVGQSAWRRRATLAARWLLARTTDPVFSSVVAEPAADLHPLPPT